MIPLKADFHSVQNIARSIFSERFLLKSVKSATANEICSVWLFVIQKKALAKARFKRRILHAPNAIQTIRVQFKQR